MIVIDPGLPPVSIHAPAGGATNACTSVWRAFEFRSTLPQGERPAIANQQASSLHVSIHAPAGGATNLPNKSSVFADVSIHAPAGGATI